MIIYKIGNLYNSEFFKFENLENIIFFEIEQFQI